jgi:hypothetical protein
MAKHGAIDHAAFAELHGGQYAFHGPGPDYPVGDAIAVGPAFYGFYILLRPYQLGGLKLFQFHARSVTIRVVAAVITTESMTNNLSFAETILTNILSVKLFVIAS